MNYDYSGEKFLDRIFKDIYLSDEVQHTSLKSDRKEEAIRKYMERLERIHKKANITGRKELIKQLYFNKYVIKKENLPVYISDHDKEIIIENQKKTLESWINYLTDENARYPMWLKYWAFQGMLKMGTRDDARGIYQRRSDKTIAPFIDANAAIIADCIQNMQEYVNGRHSGNEEIDVSLQSGSFKKLYEHFERKYKALKVYRSNSNKGIWVKYNQGSKEDAKKLYESLKDKAVPWCTKNENIAIDQICGGTSYRKGGDFYVYYTIDEEGKYSIPRIAIRMDGKVNIGEIRGILENQCLEPEMINILEKKLREMDFVKSEDIKANLNIVYGLRKLSEINKKTVNSIPLSKEEITSLYTESFGFGWQQDPLVLKTVKLRNINEDFNRLSVKDQVNVLISVSSINLLKGLIVSDRKVAMLAISKDASKFQYLSPELKADKDIVLKVVSKNGNMLEYVDPELKKDKEVVKIAISIAPDALMYASPKLQADKEIVMIAVKGEGATIKYASQELQNDREIVFAAILNNAVALKYINSPLKDDPKLLAEAVAKSSDVFDDIKENLRNDPKFIIDVVSKNGILLGRVNKKFQNNKEIVLSAVSNYGLALEYASPELKNDRDVVLAAVSNNGAALRYASPSTDREKETAEFAALHELGCLYPYYDMTITFSGKFQNDREIVMKAVSSNGYALSFVGSKFRNDKQIVLKAISNRGEAITYCGKKLYSDPNFVLEAISINGKVLKHSIFRDDPDFVMEAVSRNKEAISGMGGSLALDKDFLIKIGTKNKISIQELSEAIKNPFIAKDRVFERKYKIAEQEQRKEELKRLKEQLDIAKEFKIYQDRENGRRF